MLDFQLDELLDSRSCFSTSEKRCINQLQLRDIFPRQQPLQKQRLHPLYLLRLELSDLITDLLLGYPQRLKLLLLLLVQLPASGVLRVLGCPSRFLRRDVLPLLELRALVLAVPDVDRLLLNEELELHVAHLAFEIVDHII